MILAKIKVVFFCLLILTSLHAKGKKGSDVALHNEQTTPLLRNELTEQEKKIGRNVLLLIKEIDRFQAIKSQKLLEQTVKDIKNTPLFSHLEGWIYHLNQITQIKNDDKFNEICLQNNFVLDIYYEFFNKKSIIACFSHISTVIYKSNTSKSVSQYYLDFFSKYLDILLKEKKQKTLINILKMAQKNQVIKSELSQILSDHFIQTKTVPDFTIIQLIEITDLLKTTFSKVVFTKSSVLFQKQLIAQLKTIEQDLKKHKQVTENIDKKIQMLNQFVLEHQNLLTERESIRLIGLARSLQNKQQFKQCAQFLDKIIPMITDEEYYEAIFVSIWNDLLQNKYHNALATIKKYNLTKNTKTLPSKLLFWMAYTSLKSGNNHEAQALLKLTISLYPLSFYAIMSAKYLPQIAPSNKEELKENRLIKLFDNPGPEEAVSESLLSNQMHGTIKRFYLWKSLYHAYLTKLELNYMTILSEKEFFNDEYFSKNGMKDLKMQQVLLTAKVQVKLGEPLYSFNYLNQLISKENLPPNLALLSTLFPLQYEQHIINSSAPLDPAIIMALIRQESAFNPKAHSSAGAIGLMQVLLKTAKTIKRQIGHNSLRDPYTNISIGIEYFKKLMRRHDNNLIYALASYNAGDTNVNRWKKEVFKKDSALYTIESIPFRETRLYILLILRNIFFYKLLSEKNNSHDHFNTSRIFDIHLGMKDI